MRTQRFSRNRRAIVAATLLAATPAMAANLLINPGFEAPAEPPAPNSNVTGWTLVNDAQRAAFNNHTPGGVFMLWAKTFQPVGGGAFQDVNIFAGQTYNMSSWLFFEGGYTTITDPVAARLAVSWLTSGGSPVGSPTILDIPASPAPPTGTWTEYFLPPIVAPAGSAKARVFVGWDGGGPGVGAQSVFFDDVVFDGPGTPPNSGTWIVDNSGDWNAAGNWAGGTVPNSVGATVEFLSAITANRTIYTNSSVTVGTMRFNNPNTYVITGAGDLTLDVASGSGSITVQAGNQKINLPMTIADNTTINVAGGATLRISDPVTLNSGITVNQTGAGQVIYQSTVDVSSGSRIAFGNSSHMAGLNLASNAIGTVTPGGDKVMKIDNLAIASSAKLDLHDNDMIVKNSSETTIRNLVANGRAFGAWNGNGINSTAAATNANQITGLGVLSGADYIANNGTTFGGYVVASTDTLVKYTYNGDTDFNGAIDFDDYARIDTAFLGSGLGKWIDGDSDYSGTIDFDDYALIDAAFLLQGGPLDSGRFGGGTTPGGITPGMSAMDIYNLHASMFGEEYTNAFWSLVPEPSSLSLLALGALAVGRRRR
jgi:hypothetical protein